MIQNLAWRRISDRIRNQHLLSGLSHPGPMNLEKYDVLIEIGTFSPSLCTVPLTYGNMVN